MENTKIIAVSSCKGGVGKSTVAASLALNLAKAGYKTGLLDADVFGPSMPTLFNTPNATIHQDNEGRIIPFGYTHNLQILSFAYLMKGDGPAVMRGPMVSGYLQKILTETNWDGCDYLIIDMPPGTGDVQLTITQTARLDGALVVTTRQNLSLVDVEKGIEMFEKVDVPVLGIVENMAFFRCGNCGEEHPVFGEKKVDFSRRYGLNVLASIPLDPLYTGPVTAYYEAPEIAGLARILVDEVSRDNGRKQAIPETEVSGDSITFIFEDGERVTVKNRTLRASCQCASCVDEFTGKQLLDKDSIPADIHPEKILPIGNYAVRIEWSDHHSSGIFSYKMIRSLQE
ncbi:MAG: P-loop NTPase [Fibrobacterota bacterium]